MSNEQGPVVEEVVTRLRSAGAVLFEWRCTPRDLSALVVGRLYVEGMIDNGDVADALEVRRSDDEIEIAVAGNLIERTHSVPAARTTLPDLESFADLFRELFAGVDERNQSGGMHAAALASNGRIAFQAEDVGRHNAVDKAIGLALLAHELPADYGMLISSRISGEIARKAARAGVAWLASRSIPTTLALRIAGEAALPVIGRAAGKGAVVYR